MAKKIVELSTKKKVQLKEMSIDEVDFCNDITILKNDENGNPYVTGVSKSRTAWLRRGIKGGDFKAFKANAEGLAEDSVLRQLNEEEKNELVALIQEYQEMGE
tara:strand:- start:342 stop:650 length:309 start_codon:yes stop_codon:yes gene_type:complete